MKALHPPLDRASEGRRAEELHNECTFFNARGQCAGILRGGWLVKRVDSSKHQLRRPPAWAIDEEHFAELQRRGALGVELTDERGQVWRATLDTFEQHGFAFNRGHGEQVALPLGFWRVESKEARQLELFPAGAAGGAA
jgi:hypothetical protein